MDALPGPGGVAQPDLNRAGRVLTAVDMLDLGNVSLPTGPDTSYQLVPGPSKSD